MNNQQERSRFVTRLFEDVIGPHNLDERLDNKPSDLYLSGILWPIRTQISLVEDDGIEGESEDDDLAPGLSIAGMQRPSVMGVSFATSEINDKSSISISYQFASYKPIMFESEEKKKKQWQRNQYNGKILVDVKNGMNDYFPLPEGDYPLGLDIKFHIRTIKFQSGLLSTVTMINQSQISDEDSQRIEELTVFQTQIQIELPDDFKFIGLPDLRMAFDEDEASTRLLYRDSINFAFGHQCSATWEPKSSNPNRVESSWMPISYVPTFKQTGHEIFRNIVESGKLKTLFLATASDTNILLTLKQLAGNYMEWILAQEDLISSLDLKYVESANLHMLKCKNVYERILEGVNFIDSHPEAFVAFRNANMAMHLQHTWKEKNSFTVRELEWRPFQLAFILLALESTCNSKSVHRETLDLLWFPTGGGKTEAYLALIAIGSWYRRLTNKAALGGGNFAIMRYTLRLLTAQQFERASAVILACEVLRRNLFADYLEMSPDLEPFSIGLWVGKDASPNNFDDAVVNRGNEFLSSPEQIRKCFSCDSKLTWTYDSATRAVRPKCVSNECILGGIFGSWPVITIDDDIYKTTPTLIIGTVDKFAQIPLKIETASMLGFKSKRSTELIIQDELHLISGPLGSMVGIYETALDWLLTREGARPKIIGSTATIRRATSQVRALFDRDSCQFPPAGLSFVDSGFAVVDGDSPGRLYVGITTAGRSAKFTLQGVAGSLLQSGQPSISHKVEDFDGYTTLLMYFNALRELGGAIVQVLDDVPDSMSMYADQRIEIRRDIDAPKELTSRVSQREIISILSDLSKPSGMEGAVDVVLATNMVSVGVDVPRLGLMLVNGQPKTRAEYIQSTSRVGRSDFPGLIVCLFNAMKARDRSHYETFGGLHQALYRDVEATSVTPFASRSRDRALRAVLISMIRHSDPSQRDNPNFGKIDKKNLQEIISFIEDRVQNIQPEALKQVSAEIDEALYEWSTRDVRKYLDRSLKGSRFSLLQYAEDYARRLASGNFGGTAWPIMNTMRSVEASTPFRLKEKIFRNFKATPESATDEIDDLEKFPWRRKN